MRSRKATIPICFYGGNNSASYSSEAYVIELGHINVRGCHVCHRSAPLGTSQGLTVGLHLFVIQPNNVESFNVVTCCGYCQRGLFDVAPCVRATPPEG